MKRKITLLLMLAASAIRMEAQQVFSESFNAPFNPVAAGWNIQNLSAPVGSTSWFQGSGNQFPALSGGLNDYAAANFNNTAPTGTNNTISTWLITPTLNLVNGGVLEFATRNSIFPFGFADRLQVYSSTAGAGTNVGAGPGTATNTAGTYTNILLDINPTLVFGLYPDTWTIYTVTLTNIPTPTVGRLAFRYYVTNGGNAGTNSNYVGIDDVSYSLPCNFPKFQLAQTASVVCAGSSTSLSVVSTGSVPNVTSYTWAVGTTTAPASNPTANVSPLVVTPTLNTIYIVTAESTPGCYSKQLISVYQGFPPGIQATSYTVCGNPPTTVTLTASGGGAGAAYQWSNGGATNSIVVTPNVTTVYTVTGTTPNSSCPGVAQATVTLGNNLSMNILSSSFTNTLCSSGNLALTFTASGAANNILWSNGATTPVITVTPNVTTTYTVGGMSGNCIGSSSITIVIKTPPTVSLTVSPSPICSGVVHTLTATGAVTYSFDLNNPAPTWIAASTVTFVPNVTNMFLFVSGTGTNGCMDAAIINATVQPTPTVTAVASKTIVCSGATVTFTASGASTYSWSGAASSTNNPLSYVAGTVQGVQQFSVVGTSTAGCRSTFVTTVSVNKCTGIDQQVAGSGDGLVFPNPFSNSLRFSGLEGRVVLYNALGQAVLQETVTGPQSIDTSALPAGIYILKVYDPQENRERDIKLLKHQ
jgi:hypothetical protein